MSKKLLISVLLCFFIFSSFISLNAQWARTYGGVDADAAIFIHQTSDGAYIVTGSTKSFGAGDFDIWVIKLDLNGVIEWERTYGGGDYDSGRSIHQTSDGGYIVTGSTKSFGAGDFDIWVIKLDSTGKIEWQNTYGGPDRDDINSIQQTNDEGYVVAGSTYNWGAGFCDIWILKLSSTGSIEWQKTYGGSDDDYGWSIEQTSDGGYIVAGETLSFGFSGNAWILKLSSTGSIEWQRTYGGSEDDYARSIHETSDGGYIVADITQSFGAGLQDFWILKLNSVGVIEWQRTYGGSEDDNPHFIQQTNEGGYIVAGITYSFGGGSLDFWVMKLSSNGVIEWQRTYGGNDPEYLNTFQKTNGEGYIVGGHTRSFSVEANDALILKLYSDGDIDSSCDLIGSSDATITDTSISPVDTYITPGNTYVTPLTTSVTPQNTNASVMLLCEAPKYDLTISSNTGGTTDPAPNLYTYYSRTEVQVEAIPDTGYRFSGWTGDVPSGHENDNPITITMDSDKSIEANFSAITTTNGEETGKKGGCFIATAAYGSPIHPHLDTLRDFRDKYFMPNKLGRAFVNLYYKYSPFVANIIAKRKVLKFAVRINLLPLVVLSYSMVYFGPTITAIMLVLIFALPILFIASYRKKLMRLEAKSPKALASLD